VVSLVFTLVLLANRSDSTSRVISIARFETWNSSVFSTAYLPTRCEVDDTTAAFSLIWQMLVSRLGVVAAVKLASSPSRRALPAVAAAKVS